MLRITTISDDGQNSRLKVEGRLVGSWVSELEQVCRSLLVQKKMVFLDFSEVGFIDRQGVEVVKRILGDRVEILGASRLVQALLEGGSNVRNDCGKHQVF